MNIVDDKINEIFALCAELQEASVEIAKLEPVTHLSKVQWTGLIGAVQEIRADKRLVKMINAPLYKDMSFFQFGFYLAQTSEKIVESIIVIQKNLKKEDERYYGIVRSSLQVIMDCINTWYNYSPDMAEELITIGDQKDVSIGPSIKQWVKDEFAKLDLPDELRSHLLPDHTGGTGCFGMFLILLSVGSIGIYTLTILFAVIL